MRNVWKGDFMGYWGVVMQDAGCELPRIPILGTWVNSGPRPSGDLQLRRSAPPHLLVSVQEFAECRLLACAIVVHERGQHASVLP
jgi:hypothetical protein